MDGDQKGGGDDVLVCVYYVCTERKIMMWPMIIMTRDNEREREREQGVKGGGVKSRHVMISIYSDNVKYASGKQPGQREVSSKVNKNIRNIQYTICQTLILLVINVIIVA